MDLGSILNADDRSKMPSQTYTRTIHSGHHGGNNSGKIAGRPMAGSVKTGPIYSPVFPAHTLSRSVPSNVSSNGKVATSRRPRINTSKLSSSGLVKQRASANSPGSHSSSSRSPPSPSTPSSTASIGRAFSSLSYSKEIQQKQECGSTTRKPGSLKHLPDVPHADQTHVNPSMISNITHTNQVVNQSQLHLNRVLPLPVARGPAPFSALLPNPIRSPIPPISLSVLSPKQQQKQPHVHSSNQQNQRICSAIQNCDYSTPKRRIVSQFFGRNKKETRMIPRHCWIYYCRQHYQRLRYRLSTARFAEMQMNLVRATITALEKESIVTSWEVRLRKRVAEKLNKSGNSRGSTTTATTTTTTCTTWGAKSGKKASGSKSSSSTPAMAAAVACASGAGEAREESLLPYCGAGKSFKQVYDILNLVDEICRRDGGPALEFEILPSFTVEWVREEENRRKMGRVDGTASNSESDDEE